MTIRSFRFGVSSFHVDNCRSRGDHNDSDWLTVTVSSGRRMLPPQQGLLGANLHAGDNVGELLLGPFEIDDSDTVSVTLAIINLRGSDDQVGLAAQTALDIAAKVSAALGGLEAEHFLGLDNKAEALVLGAAGAAVEALGFHSSDPDCRGPVATRLWFWTPGNLTDREQTLGPVAETERSPSECGNDPHSTVTYLARPAPATSALDVFWIGPDRAIATNWTNPGVDDGKWHDAFPITPPGASGASAGVTAVTRPHGALDAFWIGPDGAIATNWTNQGVDNGKWHDAFPITPRGAARANSGVTAVSRFGGGLDVFWIGPDGAIATNWTNPGMDNGKWHDPFPITPPSGARGNSGLAAVTRLNGELDVFWIGADGAIATNWTNPGVDNGKWHDAFPITPPGAAGANSGIAVSTRLNGVIDVFWMGPDGAIATNWTNPGVDNGKWHDAFPITAPGAARADSGVAAVTRLGGALDVFWIGPDGAIATNWTNPSVDRGKWHDAFPITPPGAAGPVSGVAAVTRLNGELDVFWVGPDRGIGTNWTSPGVDNGRWHDAFPIARPNASNDRAHITAASR
jgi:hypothetical protein